MDCSLPDFSTHGSFQARVLEWVVISFSRGFSRPRDQTQVSHIAGGCFTIWATGEAQHIFMHHVFFICLSVDGHLGCFHVLATVNSVAVNMEVHVSFRIMFFSDLCPGMRLRDHMVVLFLKNLYIVLHSDCTNFHLHQQCRKVSFLHTLSSIYCL